jgi:hypothetical protein
MMRPREALGAGECPRCGAGAPRGGSKKEIAAELVIAPGTVHTHVTHVYQKTGFPPGPGSPCTPSSTSSSEIHRSIDVVPHGRSYVHRRLDRRGRAEEWFR